MNDSLYVTFGQRYRHQPHPLFTKAHPDGWLELRGFPTRDMARTVAFAITGGYHAFDYTEPPALSTYPAGPLATVTYRDTKDGDPQ